MTAPSPTVEAPKAGPLTADAVSVEPKGLDPTGKVQSVIVAVHGIGDQANFGTIQTVVNQFCLYFGQPSGIPLGGFDTGEPALCIGEPHNADVFKRYAFAEVYWAAIPRELVKSEHRLEESKAWAHTIVERLRLRYQLERQETANACKEKKVKHVAPPPPNFPLVKQVLGELIQTIDVVDRLCFLADKAGVFKFNLRELLDDYLGDVQVVAEFRQERLKILKAFAETMDRIAVAHPKAAIYIVSHSEGTVVSFLGLLEGFRAEPRAPWAGSVRGLMTLGSPLDKHLVLWPELFGSGGPTPPPNGATPEPIHWRNYYDLGDPVGFELDGTRTWIENNGWQKVFDFSSEPGKHDYGFTRYPFPGKAHVDYWTDEDVFGHFLKNVVTTREDEDARPHGARRFPKPPRTKRWAWAASSIVPYIGVAAIFCVAAYILLRAVLVAALPDDYEKRKALTVGIRAVGIAALLYGMTAVSRIPRLTRRWDWRLAAGVFAAFCVYAFITSVDRAPLDFAGMPTGADRLTLWTAVVTTILTGIVSTARPTWGIAPMLVIGGLGSLLRIADAMMLAKSDHPTGPIWPVVIAATAFLYLWWLGSLMFDLVVAWQLYIRDFNLRQHLDKITGRASLNAA